MYEARVLSVLLYGAATLLTYRAQESCLSAFRNRIIRSIVGVFGKIKMTNDDLLQLTNSGPLSSRLKVFTLRWAGHVNRMPKDRLPHAVLHSVLREGT